MKIKRELKSPLNRRSNQIQFSLQTNRAEWENQAYRTQNDDVICGGFKVKS